MGNTLQSVALVYIHTNIHTYTHNVLAVALRTHFVSVPIPCQSGGKRAAATSARLGRVGR